MGYKVKENHGPISTKVIVIKMLNKILTKRIVQCVKNTIYIFTKKKLSQEFQPALRLDN